MQWRQSRGTELFASAVSPALVVRPDVGFLQEFDGVSLMNASILFRDRMTEL